MPTNTSPVVTFEQSLMIQAACMPDQIVLLRGTESHLEILIDSTADYLAVVLELIEKLDSSPPFSEGAEMIVRFSEKPIRGMVIDLEKIASMYKLTIVSIRSRGDDKKRSFAKHKAVSNNVFPESVGANIAAMTDSMTGQLRGEVGKNKSFKVVDCDISLL